MAAASEEAPLYPFCDTSKNLEDYCAPGKWPLDHLCVIRFPSDLARRLSQQLEEADSKTSSSRNTLDLHLKPLGGNGRHWDVELFAETLRGTLVDLPRHVESHVLKHPNEGDTDTILYKSADVSQLLIVHREQEPPGADLELNRETFAWSSGLTPYTKHIGTRSFRECPFTPDELHEAEMALKAWSEGKPHTVEEQVQLTAEEIAELRRARSSEVWAPPEVQDEVSAPLLDVGCAEEDAAKHKPFEKRMLRRIRGRENQAAPKKGLGFRMLKKKRLRIRSNANVDYTIDKDGSYIYSF